MAGIKLCKYCLSGTDCIFYQNRKLMAMEGIASMVTNQEHEAGDIIFHEQAQHNKVMVCCSGKVKLSSDATDSKRFSLLKRKGQLILYSALFNEAGAPFTARALEPTLISMIDHETFSEFISDNPVVFRDLTQRLYNEWRFFHKLTEQIAYASAEERVAHILSYLKEAQLYQDTNGFNRRSTINLRREDLGEMTGLTKETVVRSLKTLEESGVIKIDRRKIHLIDI